MQLLIAHQHQVERFKTYELKKVQVLLNRMEKSLKISLAQYGDVDIWTVHRKRALLNEVKVIQKAYADDIKNMLLSDMEQFTGQESIYYTNTINDMLDSLALKITTVSITPEKIYAVATNSPVLFNTGETYTIKQLIKNFTNKNISYINQTLKQGFILSENGSEISRKLFGPSGLYLRSRREADTLVRTTIGHYSSRAKNGVYKANMHIIKGYQWVAILDNRTTPICQNLDGKVWYYDAPEKSTLPGEIQTPYHFNCRSVTVPVTKSWKELGIPLEELPAGTRASMNGQVPSTMNYKEWLETQSSTIQRDVLGTTRYDMWKSGEIQIRDFYSRDNRYYTLKELAEKGYKIPNRYKNN